MVGGSQLSVVAMGRDDTGCTLTCHVGESESESESFLQTNKHGAGIPS